MVMIVPKIGWRVSTMRSAASKISKRTPTRLSPS
jgi:hypothetical protein